MNTSLRHLLGMTALCSLFVVGCATAPAPQPIDITAIRTEAVEVPEIDPAIANAGIQRSSLQNITTLVQWPAKPTEDQCAASVIETSEEDGVLIEGRAYIRRSLDELYGDLITPEIIGPRHMTQDFVQDLFEETPLKTSFTLHVQMKYILTIQFDLAWTVEPVFENGKRVGYYATAEKTEGTRYIKQISNRLTILEEEPGLLSVEISSANHASMNKVDESKGYVVGLFDFWSNVCHAAQNATTPASNAETSSEMPNGEDNSIPADGQVTPSAPNTASSADPADTVAPESTRSEE